MTPLDAAKAAFVDEFRRPWDATVGAADCNTRSIEAACLAYVRARSEDEATVDRVAKAMMVRKFGPEAVVMFDIPERASSKQRLLLAERVAEARLDSRAALKVLATKEPT